MKKILFFLAAICTIVSCKDLPLIESKNPVPMYPDYMDITIPVNIAPLNFLLRNNANGVKVIAGGKELYSGDDNKVTFDISFWKSFIKENSGKTVDVKVIAREGDKWVGYNSFKWQIVKDSIDSYLTYRLIEPDYEIFNNLQIHQRCVENFDESALCDHNLVNNSCMNCHIVGNQNPNLSMMYVRGKNGGAVLNRNGELRKLDLKKAGMISSSVYAGFNHTGRYIVFSTNIIIPAFHAQGSKRLEVFDSKSDVYIADLDKNVIFTQKNLCDSTVLETFPTFSPDGKYIYFCSAKSVKLPEDIKKLKYSLCRTTFNENNGKIGQKVDTIFNANAKGAPYNSSKRSVCHPRVSPDGKYILYTVADYGTFPIWHREADLQMMNLKTRQIDTLAIVNSNRSDTYHSWSSNSRWFVFASKRDDGLYGKPYFCYIDRNGKAHKPFVLPQSDPSFYDLNLKSFNIPELSKGKIPFNAVDVQRLMDKKSEKFK